MNDLNFLDLQRWGLLAIFGLPLLVGLALMWLGQSSSRGLGGLARFFALLHFGATTGLVLLSSIDLTDRGANFREFDPRPKDSFLPTAIPGDPGISGTSGTQAHFTTWVLFTVQKVPSELAKIETPTAIQFFLGLDGLNVWLVWLTSFLTLLGIAVSSKNITERVGTFYGWLFILESLVIGAFTAFDIVLFYVFFELTLIPTFFLIGQWGIGSNRRDAARKFFLYTLFGSLLTLTGAIGIVTSNPIPVYGAPGSWSIMPKAGAKDGEVMVPESGPITFSIPSLIKNFRIWTAVETNKVEESQKQLDKIKAKADAANKAASNDPSSEAKRRAADQAEVEIKQAEAAHAKVLAHKQQRLDYQALFFFLLMAGFAVKVPIVPFHTWLPGAYGEAPIGVTLLMSGVLAKLGTYGILRVVLPLTPDACVAYGLPVFGTLGAIGILYAAFCAYSQRDIKMLTAYSSVSHLGLLVLGLFALNREGLSGAALHMVNHGLSTGAMFALLAFLYDRYRTTDSTLFSGLMSPFPAFSVLMMVIALASVGLPGLNNFISEMLILSGLITPSNRVSTGYWLVVAGAAGIFFSAWYTFSMIRRVFFGPTATPTPLEGVPTTMTQPEIFAFGLPAVFCLALGLYPQPLLDSMIHDTAIVARLADEARSRAGVPSDPAKERPRAAEDLPKQGPATPGGPPGVGPKMPGAKGAGGGAKGGQGGQGGKAPAGQGAGAKGGLKGPPGLPPPPAAPAPAAEVAPTPTPKK